ncbi:MAG: hypothetical protein KJ600_00705 [Nanoarchaeota archaeon]|nr:hypothetical protein [Nanoarchaeota archaeon]MBU1103063.1 hypothetical protein [Nanoarchaeota archaeon]
MLEDYESPQTGEGKCGHSYVITLDHLPIRKQAEFLKRRGVTNRQERREAIESIEERSRYFSLTPQENDWYHDYHKKEKRRARDDDDEMMVPFNKFFLTVCPITGITTSICTGQLRWIPIGIAAGIAIPFIQQTMRDIGYAMENDSEIFDYEW